jgi:D-alanyl-D-alanine carboxypeptidase (penicillin-binding protein 5/6)
MNIGADGLKTGFTEGGGYGLVGSATQNGLRLIVVINGLKSANDRANEGKRLLEWGFKGFEARFLFAEGQNIGDARLFGGAQVSVPLMAAGGVNLLVPRGSNDRIMARIVYSGPVRAPVEKGQPIGTLKVWRSDNLVLEVPLQAAESVEQGGLTRRAFDAASELVIGLFRSGSKRI